MGVEIGRWGSTFSLCFRLFLLFDTIHLFIQGIYIRWNVFCLINFQLDTHFSFQLMVS